MKIGADPEVFWENEAGMVSVIGRLGGTKNLALKINDIINVLEDNVAAEFNFPPCDDLPSFVESITRNLEYLKEVAHKFGADLSKKASAQFPHSELIDPGAFVFGCEPDYNAWTGEMNPPIMMIDPTLRSAGGHVHVGHGQSSFNVVRAMDVFLGVPSIFMDGDTDRRKLYGRAGACRPKDYGDEYRTLSNFWIFDPKMIQFVYERTKMAVEWSKQHSLIPDSPLGMAVVDAINNSNFDAAKFVFTEVPDAQICG